MSAPASARSPSEIVGIPAIRESIRVDESKEILRKLSLKSFEGSYKVMLIWNPEEMNTACSNKLLKILEEPPAQTLFLLV